MREIKFRAWDLSSKTMNKVSDIVLYNGNEKGNYGEVFYEDGEIASKYFGKNKELEQCKVMQYIGLKDMNGKEIYEGDIIEEYEGDDKIPENLIGTYQVKYIDNGFWLDDRDSEYGFGETDNMKVIGNIYEKPELLK